MCHVIGLSEPTNGHARKAADSIGTSRDMCTRYGSVYKSATFRSIF